MSLRQNYECISSAVEPSNTDFCVNFGKDAIFHLRTSSESEKDEWVEKINLSIKKSIDTKVSVNDDVIFRGHRSLLNSRIRLAMFFFSGIFLVFLQFTILLVGVLSDITFTSLIIWRGISIGKVDFLEKLEEISFVLQVNFKIPLVSYLLYPVISLIRIISTINIDFSRVNVTCDGAQAPLEFIILCIIIIFVVLVIESNFTVIQKVYFRTINILYLNASFQNKLKYSDRIVSNNVITNTLAKFSVQVTFKEISDAKSNPSMEKLKNENVMEYPEDILICKLLLDQKSDKIANRSFLSLENIKLVYDLEHETTTKPSWMKRMYSRVFKSSGDGYMDKFTKYRYLIYCSIAGAIASVDPMQKIIQYMMGFLPISAFFQKDYGKYKI